jgi:Protein of unknown function (DUF3037)
MPELGSRPFAYHIVRYTPNLIRDEWVNVGVVIHDAGEGRFRVRVMDEESEFARLRRLHPGADEGLLRGLGGLLDSTLAEHREGLSAWVAKLDQTLSNAVQFSPRKGLLADDLDAEMERLYHDHVEPPRARAATAESMASRSGIRARASEVFRSVGLWGKLARAVRVDDYTYPGDPLRLDYSYRRNGTRGFIQSLALSRDPSQAKVLAYTADAIRAKLAATEFIAVTEIEPRPQENERHRFVAGLLAENQIPLVPLSRLPVWAHQMRPLLQ